MAALSALFTELQLLDPLRFPQNPVNPLRPKRITWERRDRFPDEPAVFIALKGRARGQPLSINALRKLIAYYAAACQLPAIHADCFRHSRITQLVQHGMAEPAVRKFVGHHHPASLLPYLHLADSYVEAEFAQAQAGLDLGSLLIASQRGGET